MSFASDLRLLLHRQSSSSFSTLVSIMVDTSRSAANLTAVLKQLSDNYHSSRLNSSSNMTAAASGYGDGPSAADIASGIGCIIAFAALAVVIDTLIVKPAQFVIALFDQTDESASKPSTVPAGFVTPSTSLPRSDVNTVQAKSTTIEQNEEDKLLSICDRHLEPFVWTFSRLNHLQGKQPILSEEQQEMIENWSEDDTENINAIELLVDTAVDAIMAHRIATNNVLNDSMSSSLTIKNASNTSALKSIDSNSETAKTTQKILEVKLLRTLLQLVKDVNIDLDDFTAEG